MTVVTPRVARSRKVVMGLFVTASLLVFTAAVFGVLYALPGVVEQAQALWEDL
ncbi:hypothetical protein [Streptomyces tanashiensis]|uniref:Uncharacterized protein n=1 Tax=Streptomyces tanashiensis TaxID=67367 RepID=A0ABY6QUQ5_9ACTN|nr:hypothetical protein [Streptomyces tanashiensis]UZX21022.1 hypothetical protein LDH80_09975 [Streptomyces tanashiensis]GGY53135.1 hypothetical protein GCM10010299_69130 [Streptomyces tanashiensis]